MTVADAVDKPLRLLNYLKSCTVNGMGRDFDETYSG